jgi:hypothetical protein
VSDRPTFEDRLSDPLSHFPYKHSKALEHAQGDPAHEAEVDATAAYVAAQQAYFENPSDESRADERQAAQALQDVRADRRLLRVGATLVEQAQAEIEAAEAANDGDRLDRAEANFADLAERLRRAAARFGLDVGTETPEG